MDVELGANEDVVGEIDLNAHAAMQRAIALAKQNGLGAVALSNTNHWMRGGSYGWLAAEAGVFAVCWTNTMPNLPPWGATTPALGKKKLSVTCQNPTDDRSLRTTVVPCNNSSI